MTVFEAFSFVEWHLAGFGWWKTRFFMSYSAWGVRHTAKGIRRAKFLAMILPGNISNNRSAQSQDSGSALIWGGTGDPPVLVGDSPTGMAAHRATVAAQFNFEFFLISSGGSPDDTGQWPVPPFKSGHSQKFPGGLTVLTGVRKYSARKDGHKLSVV
jgi:hypothetical protein